MIKNYSYRSAYQPIANIILCQLVIYTNDFYFHLKRSPAFFDEAWMSKIKADSATNWRVKVRFPAINNLSILLMCNILKHVYIKLCEQCCTSSWTFFGNLVILMCLVRIKQTIYLWKIFFNPLFKQPGSKKNTTEYLYLKVCLFMTLLLCKML